MLPGIFDRVDFNQRIVRVIRVFLQIYDPVVVHEKHLVRIFFARFLRFLLVRYFFGYLGDRLAFGLVHFRRCFSFAVNAYERIRVFYIVGRIGTSGQQGDDEQQANPGRPAVPTDHSCSLPPYGLDFMIFTSPDGMRVPSMATNLPSCHCKKKCELLSAKYFQISTWSPLRKSVLPCVSVRSVR